MLLISSLFTLKIKLISSHVLRCDFFFLRERNPCISLKIFNDSYFFGFIKSAEKKKEEEPPKETKTEQTGKKKLSFIYIIVYNIGKVLQL